jgi:hypothetical protein
MCASSFHVTFGVMCTDSMTSLVELESSIRHLLRKLFPLGNTNTTIWVMRYSCGKWGVRFSDRNRLGILLLTCLGLREWKYVKSVSSSPVSTWCRLTVYTDSANWTGYEKQRYKCLKSFKLERSQSRPSIVGTNPRSHSDWISVVRLDRNALNAM